MKTGVILARFQPIHKGHLALIEQACVFENRNTIKQHIELSKLIK